MKLNKITMDYFKCWYLFSFYIFCIHHGLMRPLDNIAPLCRQTLQCGGWWFFDFSFLLRRRQWSISYDIISAYNVCMWLLRFCVFWLWESLKTAPHQRSVVCIYCLDVAVSLWWDEDLCVFLFTRRLGWWRIKYNRNNSNL